MELKQFPGWRPLSPDETAEEGDIWVRQNMEDSPQASIRRGDLVRRALGRTLRDYWYGNVDMDKAGVWIYRRAAEPVEPLTAYANLVVGTAFLDPGRRFNILVQANLPGGVRLVKVIHPIKLKMNEMYSTPLPLP
jgi:hypothetical protein